MGKPKQDFGKDKRGELRVDPKVELQDYSGPFKPDLRLTDFSRKQLGNMYLLAHHYNYSILRVYRDYIESKWGLQAMCEANKDVWGSKLVTNIHRNVTEAMNIRGQDLEAFMKAWQIDLNSMPGDYFDVIFEMPSRDRGVITFNRCPIVEEFEERGLTDEVYEVCIKTCPPAITATSALYNADIELKVMAMPPRKNKEHICCQFEVCYKNNAAKAIRKPGKASLKIDLKKKDIRGDLKVNPKIEMKDYSGPFKPDLRITDFSREQLARMYLMAHQYDLDIMMSYQKWAAEKYGIDAMSDMTIAIWGELMIDNSRHINARFMNIHGNSIETFMKAWQIDLTSLPPNFDLKFEMPSKNRGIITFNKCIAVEMMEPMGLNDILLKFCAMDPPSIGNSAKLYHPDMGVRILAFPPREHPDDVCCQWELYYESK